MTTVACIVIILLPIYYCDAVISAARFVLLIGHLAEVVPAQVVGQLSVCGVRRTRASLQRLFLLFTF